MPRHTLSWQLCWLPVNKRVEEKALEFVFKSKEGLRPSYLAGLLQAKVAPRALRSSDTHSLLIPFFRLRTVGDRSFCSAGPRLWNKLPQFLRDGTLFCTAADPGTSFSARLHSYLITTHCFGLSPASSVLRTLTFMRAVGYRKRTESPSGCVYAIENSPA